PGLATAEERLKGQSGVAGVDGDYKIGPEDVLDVAVWNNTAISRTVPVRPDGKISLPLLNDVQAAWLTPTQLPDVLTTKPGVYGEAENVLVQPGDVVVVP